MAQPEPRARPVQQARTECKGLEEDRALQEQRERSDRQVRAARLAQQARPERRGWSGDREVAAALARTATLAQPDHAVFKDCQDPEALPARWV